VVFVCVVEAESAEQAQTKARDAVEGFPEAEADVSVGVRPEEGPMRAVYDEWRMP
jgi:hypothetical protein